MNLSGNNRMLSMMKALLPCIPPSSRKLVSFLILMLQIQEAFQCFQEMNALTSQLSDNNVDILDVLKKNCTPEEQEMFENYETLFQTMQMFQSMQDMQNDNDDTSEGL